MYKDFKDDLKDIDAVIWGAYSNAQEITVSRYCPHQMRVLTVSTDPFKNECERCYDKLLEERNSRLT